MEPDEPITTDEETTADANLAPDNFSDVTAESDAGAETFALPADFTSTVASAEQIWDEDRAESGDEPASVPNASSSAESEPADVTDASGETAVEADPTDAEDSDVSSSESSTDASEDYPGSGIAPTYEQAIAEIDRLAESSSEDVADNAGDTLPETTAGADPYAAPPITYEQAMAEIDRFAESLRSEDPSTTAAADAEPSAENDSEDTPSATVADDQETSSTVDSEDSEPAQPATEEPVSEALSRSELNAMLSSKARDADEDLSWKTSVVDLLKLVGKDSSFAARERYAVELGFPEDKLEDTPSAELNMWLHKQLMTTLADNGGTLPSNLA